MRCLNLVEKTALYLSSIIFGCLVVYHILILRTQTMAVVKWVLGIDLTLDNLVFGVTFILIVCITLSSLHRWLDPEPLNCSNPMTICFIGLFFGALAALITVPLGFLGLGLIASSLVRFVWAIIVLVTVMGYFIPLQNEYNPPKTE